MQDAAFDTTSMAYDAQNGRAFANDDKLIVQFHMEAVQDKDASRTEGRPIFRSKEFVRIIVPGDKNNIVNRPVWEQDLQRFPRQYQAFKNGQTQEMSGTPLETVPWITREQVEELKYFNVRTLEQMANIPDVHAQKFMGVNTLRQKARDAIQYAKEQAPILALAESKRENAELRDLVEKLSARVGQLEELDDEEEVTNPPLKAK
jgi:hypothetical protein